MSIPTSVLDQHCVIDEVPEEKEEKELSKTSSPQIPPQVVEISGCPCIISSGKNKGKVCGRKIKEDGKCGFHQSTCVRPQAPPQEPPVREAPRVLPQEPPTREAPQVLPQEPPTREAPRVLPSPPLPKPQPQEPRVHRRQEEVKVEIVESDTRCPCIIKKKGQPDKVCGRKIKQGGRCGVHYQKKCNLPPVVEVVQEAPQPKEKSPALDQDLQQLAEDIEADMEEQVNVVEIRRDLDKATSAIPATRPIIPVIEEEGWVIKEQTQKQLLEHITKLTSKSVNLTELSRIEEQIIQCLTSQ